MHHHRQTAIKSGQGPQHGTSPFAEAKQMKLAMQLKDYRLTTAEILYRLPDHPTLLQTYVWQEMDLAPRYPTLRQFLDFWDRELDGKIHSVRVASARLISPGILRHASEYRLN
jgi:uncharacterized protein Usg